MKNLFIFLGGGLVGAGITYIGMSAKFNKYEERINAELANISTTSESEEKDVEENADKPLTDEDVIISEEEAEKIQKEEYNKITEKYNNEAIAEEPYVIDIGEAGEFDNYEVVELTYYEDNVLKYKKGKIVEDIEYLVTEEALKQFNSYGVVAVRHDYIKKDFLISKCKNTYSETFEG